MSSLQQENGKISLGSFKLAQNKAPSDLRNSVANSKRKFESSTDKDNNDAKKDFITGISENKIQSITQEEKRGPIIIPLPEQKEIKINSKYANLIRKKTSDSATPSVEVKQEVTTNEMKTSTGISGETNPSISDLKYGLNVNFPKTQNTSTNQVSLVSIVKKEDEKNTNRESNSNRGNIEEEALKELLKEATNFGTDINPQESENKTIIISLQNNDIDLPLLIKYRDASLDEIKDEDKRFKADVDSRPQESRIEDYERTPVESFGKGLLMGMGWREGAPIGLTNPQVVQPIEFVQRPGFRTGLGANPLATPPTDDLSNKKKKRKLKPGESHDQFEQQVLLPDEDGKIRHIKHLDEKLVPLSVAKAKLASQNSIQVGSLVAIISGLHDGLKARVTSLLNNDEHLLVHLLSSGEDAKVALSDVMLLRDNMSDDFDEPMHEKETPSKSSKKSASSSNSNSSSSKGEKTSSWVYANTIVRIVSKKLAQGKYYLKKGLVRDVADASHCTLQLVDTKQLVDTSQDMLETVIPKPGEKVKIVRGKHSGKIGRLISKDKDKSGESIATVQMLSAPDENQILQFDLDYVTQFVGDDDF